MLELKTWYVSTHVYVGSENIPLSAKALLHLLNFDVIIFTQSNIARAGLESSKITVIKNINFTDNASGIWLLDCSKLARNRKN